MSSKKDIRIGVYICWCGSNIAKMVDVEGLAKEIGKLPNVVVSKDYKYMCSDPGQDLLVNDIKENSLNRIVVAACSPRMHEATFRRALAKAGINPYLLEVANIREQCAWVHTEREPATKKAKDMIIAARERVLFHEPLEKREVVVNPATLVIGGGVSGLTAALEIADAGKPVFLVEKSASLGGRLASFDLTFPYLEATKNIIQPRIAKATIHKQINLFLESEVSEVSGSVGDFKVKIKTKNKLSEITVGHIVVAIGFDLFDASKVNQYGYGRIPNVITSLDFEKMAASGAIATKAGSAPRNVVIINCVGSRSHEYNEYCSRTCCLNSLKHANQVRSACPGVNIYVAYTDMRVFGKGCEEFYERTAKNGVKFVMFDKKELSHVKKVPSGEDSDMIVTMSEKLSGEELEIPADLVILEVGQIAQKDAEKVGHLVGISKDKDGFFIEKHPKLDPVATTTDGVFIAGCCQGPKDIPDSISQGSAAAARILSTVIKGKVEVEVITSVVNEDICSGCQTCILVCPYTAISFDAEKKISVVNEVICKGCGTCTSACPSGAIRSKHFTRGQIMAQIEGMLSEVKRAAEQVSERRG